MPRTVPSIEMDAPSGTDVKLAVPMAATAFNGAETAGVAVHVCHTSQAAAASPAHTPATTRGILRDVAGGLAGACASTSDLYAFIQLSSSTESCSGCDGCTGTTSAIFFCFMGFGPSIRERGQNRKIGLCSAASLATVIGQVRVPTMGDFPFAHLAGFPA